MSKTTQENSNAESTVQETVSNTSKPRTRTSKSSNTNSTNANAANTTKKPARAPAAASRSKATASTAKKVTTASSSKTQTSGQQDKIMSQNTVRRVAIIGGNRIPFARSNGPYFRASNIDMLTASLNGLIERFNLQGQRLGEVVAGAVLKHSRDFNMTRECVLNTQLAPETPAYDIQQACGTGLQAAFLVANKIALGRN